MTAFGASSSVASSEARVFSHHFTFGADLVFFGWLIYHLAASNMKTWSQMSRWTCLTVVSLGSLLLLLDPLRHVLLDHDGVFFPPQRLAMYAASGGLSAIGRFCQICTILGIVFLVSGVVWSSGLLKQLHSLTL